LADAIRPICSRTDFCFPSERASTKSWPPTAAHRVLIRFVQCLCVFLRKLKELRGKSYYPIRVALFYPAPKIAHNFIFACTRCDAENTPPVRLKLRATLSLTVFSRLAPLLVSTPFSFPSLFRLAQTLDVFSLLSS
jgi:hypothetical protein